MRVTLITGIVGIGGAGDTVDDDRGADWIARGLAQAERAGVEGQAIPMASVSLSGEVKPSMLAGGSLVQRGTSGEVAVSVPLIAPEPKVPDFFAPEPPATEPEPKPHKRRRHHE